MLHVNDVLEDIWTKSARYLLSESPMLDIGFIWVVLKLFRDSHKVCGCKLVMISQVASFLA